MCCSRKPRGENIIRDQSKKPSNSCWGKPEEDGWTEGKDNIGFKNQNNKKSTSNANGSNNRSNSKRSNSKRSNSRRGKIHPQ